MFNPISRLLAQAAGSESVKAAQASQSTRDIGAINNRGLYYFYARRMHEANIPAPTNYEGAIIYVPDAESDGFFQGSNGNEWIDLGGVTQIIAGTNITITPTDGLGIVTINSSSGELSGHGSPVGVVTPSVIGEQYVDEDSGVQWTSTGLTDTDWVQVGDQGETCDIGAYVGAHAEGGSTQVFGNYAHAEGNATQAGSVGAHSEGDTTVASGNAAHAEGFTTQASGQGAHSEGFETIASGQGAHAEGNTAAAYGDGAHAEGFSQAIGEGAHSEGVALAYWSGHHAESGRSIVVVGDSQYSRITSSGQTTGSTGHLIPAGGALIEFMSATPSVAVYDRTMMINLTVVARRIDVPGTDSAWACQGVLRGDGSSSYSWIAGVPIFAIIAQDAAASSWQATVVSPSANLLQIQVVGETGNTINWTAVAEFYEVQG